MTVKMIMGCALAIAGFCIYSHAKMYAKPQAPQPTAADVEAAQQKVIAHAAQNLLWCSPCACLMADACCRIWCHAMLCVTRRDSSQQ